MISIKKLETRLSARARGGTEVPEAEAPAKGHGVFRFYGIGQVITIIRDQNLSSCVSVCLAPARAGQFFF